MRTRFRYLVVPLVLVLLLVSVPATGQYKINTFDKAAVDSMFAIVFNGTANNTDPKPYHRISDDATIKHEGSAALKNEWRMHTTESWGGLNMLSMTLPTKKNTGYFANSYRAKYGDSTYVAWGTGTNLSLWYYNQKPSNRPGSGVQMRFHIYEGGPGSNYYKGDSTNYEDWYYQSPLPLNDTVAGWHQLLIPLVDTGLRNNPGSGGFCITDWSGAHHNDKLDLDNIIGYTIEWTAGTATGDTASGIVFYDDLRLEGVGKKPGYLSAYNFSAYTTGDTLWRNGWNNGGLSKFDLSRETADTLMGTSTMGADWAINVKETWGGGANKEYNLPTGVYWPDLSSKQELQLFMKVVNPLVSTKGAIQNKITLRFVLFDYSNGSKEEWYTNAPVRIDSVGATLGWQLIRIPLDWIQSGNWGDLKAGRFNTPNGSSDQILALDKIGGFKLEFSCSADAGEPNNDPTLVYSGKVLFSNLVPSGVRQTDKTPPAPVTSVQAITTQPYQNIITWADVPNEAGSRYTVWVSEKPFTKTTDAGVENVPSSTGVSQPLGTQLITHNLIYPKVNHSVTLYYGVTAMDSLGNTNNPTVIGPITNTAKGVPTITWGTVNNFVANGDLSEWASVPPINLAAYSNPPSAYIVTNTTISSDADCSAKAYLAADANYLYVAFDVTDDIVSVGPTGTIDTTSGSSWLQDSPDLFIGLFDWRSAKHGSYQRGAAPDYHLRFSLNKAISDNPGATLLTPGPDYIFNVNQIVSGYQVEARIAWSKFKTAGGDTLFVPQEGMRIPIDFELNDNDAGSSQRQGQLDYSQFAGGNSYADAWRWTYTWIGSKSSTVGVDEQPTLANVYALHQNYPNPFNPSTIIKYSLAKSGPVSVKVFDVLGRVVATLVNGEVQSAGEHQVRFNTSTLRGGVSTGVYFYQIDSGTFRDVKKMMLLK